MDTGTKVHFGSGASGGAPPSGGVSLVRPPAASPDVGKFNMGPTDLSNPVAAFGAAAKAGGDFISGITGLLGSIGIPGGPNLGGIAKLPTDVISNALGGVGDVGRAVGGISLPYLGGTPGTPAATIGDIPGKMAEIIGLPQVAVQRTVAGFRAENRLGLSAADQQNLDSGMSVSEVADRMVAQNAGYIDNPIINTAASIAFDPTMYIGLGTGGLIHGAAIGEHAAQAGLEAGMSRAANGIAEVALRGTPEKVAAELDKGVASVIQGVSRSTGRREYAATLASVGARDPIYADRFTSGYSAGAGQYLGAVAARSTEEEMHAAFGSGRTIETATQTGVRQAVGFRAVMDTKRFARDAENMADRVAPTFIEKTNAEKLATAADLRARTTGMPLDQALEDVTKQTGGKPSIQFMRTEHLAHYGSQINRLDEVMSHLTPEELKTLNLGGQPTLMAADSLSLHGGTELRNALRPPRQRVPGAARLHPGEVRAAPQGSLAAETVRTANITARREAVQAAEQAVQQWKVFADLRHLHGQDLVDRMYRRVNGLVNARALPTAMMEKPVAETVAGGAPFFPEEVAAALRARGVPPEVGKRIQQLNDAEALARKAGDTAKADALAAEMQQVQRDALVAPGAVPGFGVPPETGARGAQAGELTHANAAEGPVAANVAAAAAPTVDVTGTGAAAAARSQELPQSIKDFMTENAGPTGYRIGFAPEAGFTEITLRDGTKEFLAPFMPAVGGQAPLSVPSSLTRMMEAATHTVSAQKILNSARVRMLEAMSSHTLVGTPNITEFEGNQFFKILLRTSSDAGVSPRGLPQLGKINSFEAIAREAWGVPRTEAYKAAGGDLTALVMHGFEGNWQEVGLTQKLTGALKTQFTGVLPYITEDMYPKYRFFYSPLFRAQEIIESPFLSAGRGVRPIFTGKAASAMMKKTQELYGFLLRDSKQEGGFAHLIDGGEYRLGLTGDAAVHEVAGARSPLGMLKHVYDRKVVLLRKEANMYAQVYTEHPMLFKEALDKVSPHYWRIMEETYGTTAPREIVAQFMKERLATATFAENPAAWREVVDAGKAAFTGGNAEVSADMETVWQAYRASALQALDTAKTTHFFRPDRTFLERTINHPFLGLYPFSYMMKVGREYARFMLVRPFGLKVPLGGYEAVNRLQQAIIVQQAQDPKGFGKFMKDHGQWLYFLNILLPGLPTDLPANLPATARHAASAQLAGKKFSPTQFMQDTPLDTLQHIGIGRDLSMAQSVFQESWRDIGTMLGAAGKQYDGMFGPKGP